MTGYTKEAMMEELAGFTIAVDGSFSFRTIMPTWLQNSDAYRQEVIQKGPFLKQAQLRVGSTTYRTAMSYDGNDGGFVMVTGNINDKVED
jgi:hypothetical protein